MQVNEYKVLQEQSSKKTCQMLPEMLTKDRHLWYLFVTRQFLMLLGQKCDVVVW